MKSAPPNIRLLELSRFDGMELFLDDLTPNDDVIDFLDIKYYRLCVDNHGIAVYCEEELLHRLGYRTIQLEEGDLHDDT